MEREKPLKSSKMQLVYCHISHSTAEGTTSWLEMMQTLLPNFRATLQLSGQDYVLILDQDQSLPVADILKDTVSAMEYDFNIRLSILVGQVWTESKDGKVSPVIRAERAVFRAWIREGHQGVYRFSQLYLWGIEQADLDLTPIKASLHQLIESQDQLQDIIVALWDNGAVVTKAAQQLYLHRNSLQYKIDKWEELTGLQLKKSDRSSPVLSFSFTRCDLNGINPEFCATCTKLFFFCETCHRFVKRFHLQ